VSVSRLYDRLRVASGSALLRDAVLAGAGAAASRLFLFALGVLVSRSVGAPELFGIFSSVLLSVQLVAMFAGLGLAQTAAQAIAAADGDRALQDRTVRATLLLVLVGGGLASLLLWLGVQLPPLREIAPPALREVAGGAAVLLAAQLVVGGLEGVLRGLRMFRVLCVAGCVASAVGLAAAVPLVRALGVQGGIVAAAGFLVLQAALYALPLAPRLRGALLPRHALGRLLGLTAAPTFLNGAAWNVAMLLPPLLLVRQQGGLAQLALWNAASQIRTVVSFVPIVVANAAIPRLAAAFAQGRAWRREVGATLLLAMGAAGLAFVPVVLGAGPLMAIYGSAYAGHGGLLALVASFVLLQVLGSALFVVLLAAQRVWQTAILNTLWSAAILIVAPAWIARGGAYGLATLYLASYAPVLVVLGVLVVRTLGRAVPVPHAAPARRARGYGAMPPRPLEGR
jgi:O-antigen/teichoic acid export membrane protein